MRTRVLLPLAALLAASAPAGAQVQALPFLDDTVVQQVSLTVGPSDWATLLQNYESDDYYSASFAWNGILEEVGIRQHGHGSRSPIKPNLDVNFEYYTKKQQFLGLPFIILKANNEDPSNLHEWVSMKFLRMMGFPAPREAPAQLSVNGQYFGFYMIVEHEDETFLERNLGEDGGYLYEWEFQVWTNPDGSNGYYEFQNLGNNPNLYAQFLELKTDQSAPDLVTFNNMVQAINQTSLSDDQYIAAISPYIDPKNFLTYVAAENVLVEVDGMVGGVVGMNNFDLYQYQGATLYQVIPWDTELTFADWTWDIMDGLTTGTNINVLAQRLVAIPAYLQFYLGQVAKAMSLLGGQGGWADNEVTTEYAIIDTAASNDPNKQCMNYGVLIPCGTADFQSAVSWMHQFLATRANYVLPDLQNDGYQPVTGDPQILTIEAAAPGNPQSAATALSGQAGEAAPGSLSLVIGENLGPAGQSSANPWPRSLTGAYVAVEGVRAPLTMTSSGQIELQIPGDLATGTANVVVSVAGEMSNTFTLNIVPAMPEVLAVTHGADGSLVTGSNPAAAGETLVVYMAGLGAVNQDLAFGIQSPTSPLALTSLTPEVFLGTTTLPVLFSGLSPGYVGLYQVSVTMPAPLPSVTSANLEIAAGSSATLVSIPLAGSGN